MIENIVMRIPLFSQVLLAGLMLCFAGSGCSIRRYALNKAADALAQSGASFGSDDDPELIKAAAPFSLKLMERLLAENPRHLGLLSAAAGGFTQCAHAFVHADAGEAVARARKHFERSLVLSKGTDASPFVALAEAVTIQKQDVSEFELLLNRALAINPDTHPDSRLVNTVMQRRARWLLSRKAELF